MPKTKSTVVFHLTKVFFCAMNLLMANHPLRKYRKTEGMTLAELAQKVDMSVPSLCRIELGQQAPSLALISRLIKISRGKLRADDFLEA